ncbi:MAG: hypothetical protein ABI588_00380 [Arenimonas sp.]
MRSEVIAAAEKLDARDRLNASPVPYGHGRLDAFGQIFNAVTVEFLSIPGNQHVADAPVIYPLMWDASRLDLVQWSGSAPSAGYLFGTDLPAGDKLDLLECLKSL